MLEKWMTEINALPAKKRKNWKGHLYDHSKVRQQVRYIGEAKTAMDIPYNFAVYKQPNREGGGGWWPVVNATHSRGTDIQQRAISNNGGRMLESADMWATFHKIQTETHTGNHKRDHYVQVPTAPGEPVRG